MCSQPHISQEVIRQWEISPITYLGARYNHHWLVERRGSRLALRAYSEEPFDDIPYELEVLRRLAESGWPVPSAVEEPIVVDGQTWSLFTWLPGVPPKETGPDERRARGRLLAQLHESTTPLAGMGQRGGFRRSDHVVADPELLHLVKAYERFSPAEGHIMRWHLERAQGLFDQIDFDGAESLVLHGDFAPWNLLFEGEKLTGIIDFEGTI